MQHERDEVTRLDLVQACEQILAFTRGMTGDAFAADAKTQSAVLYQFAVIGEAVARLSDGFKAARPELPWVQIRGMRNLIVHDYGGVNPAEVWRTVEHDVPALHVALSA